jgi:hypothetical protein
MPIENFDSRRLLKRSSLFSDSPWPHIMCEPTRTIVARVCGTRASGQITDQVGLREDSRAAHASDQAHAQSGSTRRVDADFSFFINDARGGLIEAEALAKALLTGHLPALH